MANIIVAVVWAITEAMTAVGIKSKYAPLVAVVAGGVLGYQNNDILQGIILGFGATGADQTFKIVYNNILNKKENN